MMSKAAFMMQDHLRRNYVMITDVSHPSCFLVRGRLPFPQGLMAVAVLFKHQRPADVYAHPYFIEKQSDPSQPSPQLHLTEESQGIMKVISGLRYMRDDNTKLDNTMVFVTDYRVPVEGRMPRVPAEAVEPLAGPRVAARPDDQAAGPYPTLTQKKDLSLEQRAMLRRNIHHVQQLPGGGGDAGLGLGGMQNPVSPAAAAGGGGGAPGNAVNTGTGAFPTAAAKAAPRGEQSAIPGYSTFPTAEECAADAWTAYRFLKAAIFGRRALREEEERSPTRRIDAPALFERRYGGYTALYNPIEVNEKTFTELLLKLQREERVVKAIVVPTRPAWRQLQVWADVFPDAELICSGEVPLIQSPGGIPNPNPLPHATQPATATAESEMPAAAQADARGSSTGDANEGAAAAASGEWRGGCQNLGNGLTGLSFPEVDLEAEAAAERQRAEAAAARARATAEAARLEYEGKEYRQQQRRPPCPQHTVSSARVDQEKRARGDGHVEAETRVDESADSLAAQRRRQDEKIRLRREMAEEDARLRARAAARPPFPPASDSAADAADEDLVDVLWQDVSFFTEKTQQPVGLRRCDANRLRILSAPPTEPTAGCSASSGSSTPTKHVQLTPTIELLHIPGDAAAEEYVLYDANSSTLACTDLYHGEYADLDPANSWMCRVWFKFMKRGNYKRTDIAPRYKWLQVLQQRALPTLQTAVDGLTRRRHIRSLIFAHGTPPLQGGGANALRQQWSLPPLHPTAMPRDPHERR
ncbi:hypothetical protein ABL78_6474 [Leptomonas seymouri]|uniref:Uncharacterized protein n=1 Tax=Leptomonas seymouri TaxID=5684 RepID=A0A0N1II66_LEPSE|nr:hypothetical protein ABL78_6474 [Leptomonas seymouri]|eukprot:KPI84468.1 hypothetical protein ABL78_6474 [Leptomonas seymouri]